MSAELDDTSRQIILAIGDKSVKISDLETKVDAARQTIWNRVEVLVAKGYVKDNKGGFPPIRRLSLTDKGKGVLAVQQIQASVESAEVLRFMFQAARERGRDLAAERKILWISYLLFLGVEKLTAGPAQGKLEETHRKASIGVQSLRKLLEETEPERLRRTEKWVESATNDPVKRLQSATLFWALGQTLKPSREYLEAKVDMEAVEFFSQAHKLVNKMFAESYKEEFKELIS